MKRSSLHGWASAGLAVSALAGIASFAAGAGHYALVASANAGLASAYAFYVANMWHLIEKSEEKSQ